MPETILPIVPGMNQSFTCTLPVDDRNITLDFSITFNTPGQYWFMSIKDHETGDLLVDALPLLQADYPAANLLRQYSYLGIGSATIVSVSGKKEPTFESLGNDHLVIWSDNRI